MDVSLLVTRLFAHEGVEMHSLYPIYLEHLSRQQEPGGQGRGQGLGAFWRLQTHSRNTCSTPPGLFTPHSKEPCLFASNLGAANDCLHGETLEMLPSHFQGYCYCNNVPRMGYFTDRKLHSTQGSKDPSQQRFCLVRMSSRIA